jgi:hypothetical protein
MVVTVACGDELLLLLPPWAVAKPSLDDFRKMKSNAFLCMLISVAKDGALAKKARRISATHLAGSSCICERACTW